MAANMKKQDCVLYNEILLTIQKQYLQMVPMKQFDWKNIAQDLDSTFQKDILEKTYMSNQFIHYTPSIKYKRMFLKHLMKKVEEANFELADELYECYGEVVSKVEDDQSCCYKIYILPSGHAIALEESQNIISQGTTGLSTWQAALYMLEWALENCNLFQNRNVLELGCGLGLLGLSICASCSPWHYIFSDCHKAVLVSLNKNLSINGYHRSTVCHCETNSVAEKTKDGTMLPKCPFINGTNVNGSQWTSRLDLNNDNFDIVSACSGRGVHEQLCDSVEQERTFSNCQNYKDSHSNYPISAAAVIKKVGNSQENVEITNSGKIDLEKIQFHRRQPGEDSCCNKDETPVTLCELTSKCIGNVALVKLDWENVRMEDLERLSCGIILATDVVYDVELIKLFIPVLFKLLSCHGDGSAKPVAFVASTIRNPETFQCFLQELDDHHIKWTDIDKLSRTKWFFYDDNSDVRLMKLQL